VAQSLGREGTLSHRNDFQASNRLAANVNAKRPNGDAMCCSSRRSALPEGTSIKQPPSIALSEPFPLLESGSYVAVCNEATFAWARQWRKWIARLVLEPQNYQGRPYTGRLCAFLGLGKNPERPYAGPQSRFRRLFVEVNGEQPTAASVEMEMFVGVPYDIEVVTVTQDRDGRPRPPEHWYSIVREIHPCKAGWNSKPTPQPFNTEPLNTQTQRTQGTLTTDQHSNTVNTPLAEEVRIATEKLARAKSMREASR